MSKFKLVAPFMILMLVLTACPAGDDNGTGGSPGTDNGDGNGDAAGIIVTSLWGGAEQTAFEAVLAAFTEETGIPAEYEPNRTDYATVLRTRIQGGSPPDVAIIPGIGTLRSLAREGSLIPLSEFGIEQGDIEGNYPSGILDVGIVDDELYGLMVKLNSKATIWYDPARFSELGVEPATTWDELVQLTDDIEAAGSTPWSIGAGADSQWTLTDWFEITYLKMHGPEAYDTLFSPDGDWTDGSAQETIELMFGELLTDDHIAGGVNGALATAFVDAIGQVYSTSPSAEMYYGGGFVGGIAASDDVNPDLEYGTTYDWFPFPTIDGSGEGQITYGGDVMAALTDKEETGRFMEFMASPEAGQVWAEQGTIVSPLRDVDSSVYPEAVQAEAEQVASAETVRFDGSDLLPGGPDLGNLLQSALQGEDVAGLLDEFQSQITSAWEQE